MKFKFTTFWISLMLTQAASAATPINLHYQSPTYLQHLFPMQGIAGGQAQFKKIKTTVDFNQTTHTRIQQMYAGVPVWQASGVIHTPRAVSQSHLMGATTPQASMNGMIYEGLEKDLANTPSDAFTEQQKAAALRIAKQAYQKQTKQTQLSAKEESVKSIIFVDDDQRAHYAYLTQFYLDDGQTGVHRPTYIIDAVNLHVYRNWDQVMTLLDDFSGGGIGGNEKTGEKIYDGDANHLPALAIRYDAENSYCEFFTPKIIVEDASYDNMAITSDCKMYPHQHNQVAWLSIDKEGTAWTHDAVNGGYSPTLDAFYGATVIIKMYQEWYHIPVLVGEDGVTPMQLVMRVHYGRQYDNAFWDGKQMTFGDGGERFYPLTSLDVTAHEISHGFTTQQSNIDEYITPMGALHESFSDMAAAASEYFVSGKNSWMIGYEITKGENAALRYLNDPPKDGKSIDHLADFHQSMDPHLAAGIYSKAFYLIATSPGWNTHKAFDVMVQANRYYWNSSMKLFQDAACGVIDATRDLANKDASYKVSDVVSAFKQVGVQTADC